MLQRHLRPIDLPLPHLSPQLLHEFIALSEARSADRVAFGEEPPLQCDGLGLTVRYSAIGVNTALPRR